MVFTYYKLENWEKWLNWQMSEFLDNVCNYENVKEGPKTVIKIKD